MTNDKQQTLDKLISKAEEYLNTLSYSSNRMHTFKRGWNVLDEFMKIHSIRFYNPMVGGEFIESVLGIDAYSELSRIRKDTIRCANVLTEYQTTGTIRFRSVMKTYEFKGDIGEIMLKFLSHRNSIGLSKDTLDANRIYLCRLLEYLNSNNVCMVSDVDKHHIIDFINSLGFYSKSTIHCMLSSLRNFLKYLQDNSYTVIDLSYLVPKSNYKKEAHLPTTYKKDEVERLILAVDRGSPKGKRDVTMILLAARLGLRASDICGLKFESIHWETNTIILIQHKTSKKIELPLLTEIGNAMIDYLKYGRPISNLPYIFIHCGQPYDRLAEPTLHSIVSFYLKRAAIDNVTKKKHGPHALRHSLAGFLLEKKTPLPIISEVLGHTNTESTRTYLRIDLESLRQCSLEVPLIDSPYFQEVI